MEGRLFTVHFMDETGEIRATAFTEQVDEFYEALQEGQVYYVSKARVVIAKKQFSNINNDYELTFDANTEVEKVRQHLFFYCAALNSCSVKTRMMFLR